MKICVAQTKPATGDIQRNTENHRKFIDLAVSNGADIIVFPELSLTGYEPTLAKELASNRDDGRFDDFQLAADADQITIGVGMPIKDDGHITIGMILFQPYQPRQSYSKKYIHPDEEPFFIGRESSIGLIGDERNIGLAICYELSVPEHAEQAFQRGAEIYVASVAKFVKGLDKAMNRLAEIATRYSMTVFMANCIGVCDGETCAGKTAVWNKEGLLIGQLDEIYEGIIIFDTETEELIQAVI